MKTKFIITLFFVFGTFLSFSQIFQKQGAGVTIIVHGWNPNGNQPAWMTTMANAIIARSGGAGQIGTITVTGTIGNLTASCSNWNFNLASAISGEIVILVNWTSVSNHLTTGITAQSVAAAIAPKIYQSQNGQPALSELPIHLIGHSRGGGMVFEIARLLGLQGIEVEQVTALDPHPLTSSDPQGVAPPIGPGQTIDTPIQIYENILFADNYYQNITYPIGQYLAGAYNRLWTYLPGGYHNETGYTYNILGTNYNFSDHLNIILAYHGTIDLATPVTNGEATMNITERAWFGTYENGGQNAGFVYSRNIAGNRKSTDTPSSGDTVVDGYNNAANLGGSGARQTLTWTNAVWPNIISITGTMNMDPLIVGNSYSVGGADQIILHMPYRSYANNTTINIYLDNDRNPYNGAFLQTNDSYSSTGSAITLAGASFQPTELMDTDYYILVETNDGINKRYMYAPYKFYRYCYVNITDTNFESALLAIPGLDADSDSIIECSEAAAWTGTIDVSNKSISDLTGIEAFVNITGLNCQTNQLTSLNISSNTSLLNLYCGENLLTSLDVSGDTSLYELYCDSNQLTLLDVSSNKALYNLFCFNNTLTSLNISGASSLNYLDCSNNLITGIDVSSIASLQSIYCEDNSLSSLNVKNGNNFNFIHFDATNNPDLTCIQVDDAAYSTANWTDIDPGASFSNNCADGITDLEENSLSIYPNPAIHELMISNISENSIISICDLTGKLFISKIAVSASEKIDVSSLAKGVYSIKIIDENITKTLKLIKQ
jgi:hypothetical protein